MAHMPPVAELRAALEGAAAGWDEAAAGAVDEGAGLEAEPAEPLTEVAGLLEAEPEDAAAPVEAPAEAEDAPLGTTAVENKIIVSQSPWCCDESVRTSSTLALLKTLSGSDLLR